MNRPFADKLVLEQMLLDRAAGWSLASLMRKYNVKSHRSIVYLCQKHHVYPPAKPVVLYHAMNPELAITIRTVVRQFPTEKKRSVFDFKKRQQLVETVGWWTVEQFVKQNNCQTVSIYSWTL